MNIIAIDTETTGLDPILDEIIQFSAVDFDGNELADYLIKPLFHKEWPEAEKINHIPPEAVKDCPTVFDIMGEIQSVLKNADLIIGYNVNFDLSFLKHSPSLQIYAPRPLAFPVLSSEILSPDLTIRYISRLSLTALHAMQVLIGTFFSI